MNAGTLAAAALGAALLPDLILAGGTMFVLLFASFETTALACGKKAAQGGKCNTRPKAS